MHFKFQFYTTASDTWASMLLALRDAKTSIDIEHFIFAADSVGNQFLEILKKKNKEGVKVRLLLDTVGSYSFFDSYLPYELQNQGIEVRFFNPISPWRIHNFTSWFLRDHNKVIIIDKKIGFTGGVGIRSDMTDWRDTNAKVEGNVVGEMLYSFNEIWEQADDNTSFFGRIKKVRTYVRQMNFVTNAPYFKKRFLYYAFVQALRNSKKSVWLTTPYFIPNGKLLRELGLAAKRGVDVKVIVPRVFDVLLVETASNSVFSELLKNGVKIYRYQPGFIHAKTAVIDDRWATFGSFNLDNLSLIYNFEGNIVSTDKKCINELSEHFKEDLNNSMEILEEDWARRSFIYKWREFFVSMIRKFL